MRGVPAELESGAELRQGVPEHGDVMLQSFHAIRILLGRGNRVACALELSLESDQAPEPTLERLLHLDALNASPARMRIDSCCSGSRSWGDTAA